jgi:aquaporin Z
MVSARFGGNAVPYGAKVVAQALMVAAIILFMGTVSGAHLNPAVSVAFAARGDFPWKRVPAYIVAQFVGAALATLVLWAFLGKQGSAGLTLPGSGISTTAALLWEMVLTAGLVSVILGTASGAQQIGPLAAIGVGACIALAGLWGSPVSGRRAVCRRHRARSEWTGASVPGLDPEPSTQAGKEAGSPG